MKKLFIINKLIFLCLMGHSQLTIGSGSQWVNSENVTVVLNNMNFINDGTFSAGTGSLKFIGNQNSTINGTSLPFFNILEIAKTNNTKVLLNRNISVGSSINFISGQLDLNNNNILMNSTANVAGESENWGKQSEPHRCGIKSHGRFLSRSAK